MSHHGPWPGKHLTKFLQNEPKDSMLRLQTKDLFYLEPGVCAAAHPGINRAR